MVSDPVDKYLYRGVKVLYILKRGKKKGRKRIEKKDILLVHWEHLIQLSVESEFFSD